MNSSMTVCFRAPVRAPEPHHPSRPPKRHTTSPLDLAAVWRWGCTPKGRFLGDHRKGRPSLAPRGSRSPPALGHPVPRPPSAPRDFHLYVKARGTTAETEGPEFGVGLNCFWIRWRMKPFFLVTKAAVPSSRCPAWLLCDPGELPLCPPLVPIGCLLPEFSLSFNFLISFWFILLSIAPPFSAKPRGR